MGVWGGVCAFDERRFRQVVIPALNAGATDPLVAAAVGGLWRHLNAADAHAALALAMRHVDEDFTGCALGRDFTVVGGAVSESPSVNGWDHYDFVDLVERVLTRETIAAYGVLYKVGVNPWRLFDADNPWMDEETADAAVASGDRFQQLLMRLHTHDGYWTDGGTGICGWLDAEETRELAELVTVDAATDGRRIFLAVLRWAIERDLGLLWGRDLRLFYDQDLADVFYDRESVPLRLH